MLLYNQTGEETPPQISEKEVRDMKKNIIAMRNDLKRILKSLLNDTRDTRGAIELVLATRREIKKCGLKGEWK